MSYRREKHLSLTNIDFKEATHTGLKQQWLQTLENGMYGICFSPYSVGQTPGDPLSEDQIKRRMELIAPYTKWIRSFSCTSGNELIPKVAKEFGLHTLVGAWLGKTKTTNDQEVETLIQLMDDNYVDIAAVGNEVMYRGDLSEASLITYLNKVKSNANQIPVSYVDAYYEFIERPAIRELCDVLLINCYPFWEGCDLDYSLLYMKDMYNKVARVAGDKQIIVSETGWPSKGTPLEGAYPSEENAMKYFINSIQWSNNDDIPMFYFSSFDETWKTESEGDVGAYWGLWDEKEQLKF